MVQAGEGGSCQMEPAAEPWPLCAAEQPQVIRAEPGIWGLAPTRLCLPVPGCRGSQGRQLCRKKTPNFFLFQGMFPCFPAQQEQQGFQVSHRVGWDPEQLCATAGKPHTTALRVGWTLHSIQPRKRDLCALCCSFNSTQTAETMLISPFFLFFLSSFLFLRRK